MRNRAFLLTLALSSILLKANAEEPALNHVLRDSLPSGWQLNQQYFQTTPNEDRWWDSFHDPTLNALINKAVGNNYNVAAAQKRIQAAAEMSKATQGSYYPSIGVSGGWSHQQIAGAMSGSGVKSTTQSYFSLGLTMNWEIDVFGRVKAQLKSDKANYKATVAEYDATLVSLVSNLAKAYFQLRLAQAQLKISESTIKDNEELLRIAKTRYEVGLNPEVDVVQAQMQVDLVKATLPGIKADINTYINEIALLAGEYPEKLQNLQLSAGLPDSPIPGVSVNPQGLLRRRPDIVEAEMQLAATAAKVGITKKDFLPTLSLSAGIGTEAHSLKDLFGKNSIYYSVMPTLSWTVFEGMTRNAQLAEARYDMEAQIDVYNQTVMTAIEEVNNAMISWQSISEQVAYDRQVLNEAKRVLELQTDRYKQGLNDFTDVASAATSVLSYQNSLVTAQASQLAAVVTLYTALGGGF